MLAAAAFVAQRRTSDQLDSTSRLSATHVSMLCIQSSTVSAFWCATSTMLYSTSMARCVCCLSICNGCIVAKWCGIGPRLLLISNRKSHIGFQMTWKSLTLDDLEGQYCNRNCIDCSTFFLATAGLLVTYCLMYTMKLARWELDKRSLSFYRTLIKPVQVYRLQLCSSSSSTYPSSSIFVW